MGKTTKERPILFSAPMVRAILSGTKTQTRRVAKWKPREPGLNLSFSGLHLGFYNEAAGARSGWVLRSRDGGGRWNDRTYPLHCPYGAPGDRLWVRETWRSWRSTCDEDNVDDDHECYEHCDQTYVAYRATPRIGYRPVPDRATITFLHESSLIESDRRLLGPWKPAIHMPRWASRITLEITGVRVERLHEITEDDARAEGVECYDDDGVTYYGPLNRGHALARVAFERLWDEINGADSWDANPWVWVIEFRRIEAQERAA